MSMSMFMHIYVTSCTFFSSSGIFAENPTNSRWPTVSLTRSCQGKVAQDCIETLPPTPPSSSRLLSLKPQFFCTILFHTDPVFQHWGHPGAAQRGALRRGDQSAARTSSQPFTGPRVPAVCKSATRREVHKTTPERCGVLGIPLPHIKTHQLFFYGLLVTTDAGKTVQSLHWKHPFNFHTKHPSQLLDAPHLLSIQLKRPSFPFPPVSCRPASCSRMLFFSSPQCFYVGFCYQLPFFATPSLYRDSSPFCCSTTRSPTPPSQLPSVWTRMAPGTKQRRVCVRGGRDGVSLREGDNVSASSTQSPAPSLSLRLSLCDNLSSVHFHWGTKYVCLVFQHQYAPPAFRMVWQDHCFTILIPKSWNVLQINPYFIHFGTSQLFFFWLLRMPFLMRPRLELAASRLRNSATDHQTTN